MNRTMTDQIDQIEKPMCSVRTDHTRLRRATALFPASQATVSSGSQPVMTRRFGVVSARRRLGDAGDAGAAGAAGAAGPAGGADGTGAATVPVDSVVPVVVLT